ncbi:MAG: hypothetical protein KKC18_08020 [Chloroflexi bacterium]|nr:hypothetical protein [Chloroflexota bacterium]
MMKIWYVGLIAALAVGALVGCGGEEATQASADAGGDETYTSEVLDTSYSDALNASNQLLLGTMQLEGTEYAITPEQATTLLPLWRAMQGGVTAQVEVNALLKQIEGTMTQEQLQAIAAMQLTQDDMLAWMQSQGLGMGGGQGWSGGGEGLSPEEQATRQAERAGGEGMPPEFEGMSEEEREALRATMQAGGGMPGGRAGFEGMGEDEREALRATMEAGGGVSGRPGGGAGGRQFGPLLNPLIELLEARAGES